MRSWLNDSDSEDAWRNRDEFDQDEEVQAFTKLNHEVRERLWGARMAKEDIWPALFVCGANHCDSMSKLLAELGIEVHVAQADYPDKIIKD